MVMAMFHVQRQCWQRWPRVLIVERTNDDGSKEERRYVPEGKTESQWKELCCKMTGLRDKYAREAEEKARLLMEAQDELLSKQAEIDGLKWDVEECEKWRDLVWKLYAALGYARQFGEFSVVDGAVVDGILIGCSGIIEELPQLQEVQLGQMQSAADMLEQARVSGEMQATMDRIRKLEHEIERQALQGGIQRECPWCEAEREEAQDGGN